MKRLKVEFTIILEDSGEPEHIVREHNVLIFSDCEGYNALLFAPDDSMHLVWSAMGYGTIEQINGKVRQYVQQDALDLIYGRVQVQESQL